ncbi:MAG: FAD:protein FMN transferase, partial [Proteobacteria bacterium]|nr:FAD:protein FMN transferase [Pseudomonadota bacterium]
GGIAKGYAVDLAVQRLRDHGFTDFIVNAGGDLRVGGERTVWLRDPVRLGADPRRLMLRDRALATSAAYFSPVSGDGTTHLVDPASGAPYRGPTSVSVLADECMRADALTKVALFAPCAVAERVLALENAQAIVLDPCAAA